MRDIKGEAAALMRKYGTSDPFDLCESLGIKIAYEDLGSLLGAYQRSCRMQYIYINSSLDEIRARQTCAHELGHARLHSKENVFFMCTSTFFVTGKNEREANIFAAELLVPDVNLTPGATIQEIAAEYGVSQELVVLKFLK